MDAPEMRALLLQKFEERIKIPAELKETPKVEVKEESNRERRAKQQ